MINPETGNEVQELFVYAVALPDFPEDGILYFNPTVGSMKTAKAWNSQLKMVWRTWRTQRTTLNKGTSWNCGFLEAKIRSWKTCPWKRR